MPDVLSTLLTEVSRFRALTRLDYLGCLASICVLLTFCMRSMVHLRLIALLSNIAFIAYGLAGRLMPILILHCMLLLINSTCLVRVLMSRAIARARVPGESDQLAVIQAAEKRIAALTLTESPPSLSVTQHDYLRVVS